MAKLANTFTTTDATGNREELSDVVSRVAPEDTPIYSMIAKETTRSTHPEWEIDDLAAPGENVNREGDEFDYDAIDAPERVGNYTQIFRKTWAVSETQEAVDNAGRIEKIRHQKLKKGIEVRKDIEFAVLGNNASAAADPRRMGSLASWYETNVSRGALGANGGFARATGLTAPARPGTKRAFTKALLDGLGGGADYEKDGVIHQSELQTYVKRRVTKLTDGRQHPIVAGPGVGDFAVAYVR